MRQWKHIEMCCHNLWLNAVCTTCGRIICKIDANFTAMKHTVNIYSVPRHGLGRKHGIYAITISRTGYSHEHHHGKQLCTLHIQLAIRIQWKYRFWVQPVEDIFIYIPIFPSNKKKSHKNASRFQQYLFTRRFSLALKFCVGIFSFTPFTTL